MSECIDSQTNKKSFKYRNKKSRNRYNVTANGIDAPLVTINMTKSFSKKWINNTITNIDGYPLHHRRDTDHGGESHQLRMSNGIAFDIDNRCSSVFLRNLEKILP